MKEDPIVEDVRQWREQYAARFNYDLKAIFDDLRRGTEEARQAGRLVVSLPPRHVQRPEGGSGKKPDEFCCSGTANERPPKT